MQTTTKNRKRYIENDNSVQALVNRESNIRQLDVELPVKVQLSSDGKKLQIIHNDIVLNGEVKRPLIHQLGGRAWGQKEGFNLIEKTWEQKFTQNCAALEQELAAVFSRHELAIRYETDSQGQNKVYGIVTPHFIDVNQL